jgi:hypothetical protein
MENAACVLCHQSHNLQPNLDATNGCKNLFLAEYKTPKITSKQTQHGSSFVSFRSFMCSDDFHIPRVTLIFSHAHGAG